LQRNFLFSQKESQKSAKRTQFFSENFHVGKMGTYHVIPTNETEEGSQANKYALYPVWEKELFHS